MGCQTILERTFKHIQMRRFKKQMLGWLTPKVIEKEFCQTFRLEKKLETIKGRVIEVKEISKNITMIKYEKV